MQIHDIAAPGFSQMLTALSGQLAKGEAFATAQGYDPAQLLAARLAPDMFPLSSQVKFACLQATELVCRLTGQPVPALADVTGFAEARALIAATVARLDGADADALAAGADRPVELALPNGIVFDLSGRDYVRDWAIPQFHFHLCMAYAVLRQSGVAIGKADFVPHMLAHARPGTLPQG